MQKVNRPKETFDSTNPNYNVLGVMEAENLELIQLEVKTTFLHSDLKEEIYMKQPKGFVASSQEHLVCRLRKSLYGLKQAPRPWYKKFDDFIQSIGFSKSDEEHFLFTKIAQDGSPDFLIIYVEDMLLSSRHARELTELVRKLQLKFAMKDLGPE